MDPYRRGNICSGTGTFRSGESRIHDDQSREGVDEFVAKITDKSGPVLMLAKRAQLESYYVGWGEVLYNVENIYLRELMSLSDSQEGIRALVEKRSPKWTDS